MHARFTGKREFRAIRHCEGSPGGLSDSIVHEDQIWRQDQGAPKALGMPLIQSATSDRQLAQQSVYSPPAANRIAGRNSRFLESDHERRIRVPFHDLHTFALEAA
jgi:hypothetical protein